MFAWSRWAFAVANAHPRVLATADEIVPSNEEDGVAQTLRDLFLLGSGGGGPSGVERGDAQSRRPDGVLEINPYDPSWPAQFERERALLAQALPSALSIEHIGSTSVPGMSAKPTLDILAVLPLAVDALEQAPNRRRRRAVRDHRGVMN